MLRDGAEGEKFNGRCVAEWVPGVKVYRVDVHGMVTDIGQSWAVMEQPDDDFTGTWRRPAHGYRPAPLELPAFPDAVLAKAKGGRRRWKDSRGRIYEWDSRHGAVEIYDALGKHLGEYDCMTGDRQKRGNPARRIEP